MKFKKVEIQAFRAYDKANDGTFDFKRDEDGVYADFISLYAPNGFGKTSFYDAVEYGITKNINRFIKKQKFNQDTAKSEKSISSVPKQFILRNRYSDINLKSFIKLTTTDSNIPVIRNINIPSKGGRDFKFDERDTEKKYFKEVILSQEWIDAFLKEDKPEERYNTFIEYFGDKQINEYYQTLVSLLNANNKRIDALTKELYGIQLELNFDGDKNILNKVNEKILALNKAGEKLKEINNLFTETDALNLSNTISERVFEIDIEKIKANELIKYLDIFVTGNDELDGMAKYFESKNKIEQIDKQANENNKLLEKFELRNKKLNQIDSIKLKKDELSSKIQKLETLKLEFQEYLKISNEILKKREENDVLKNEIEKFKLKLNASKQKENENVVKQNSLQNQISKSEKDISNLPKLREDIHHTNLELNKSQEKLNKLNIDIAKYNNDKNLLDIAINNLNTTIENIGIGVYPSIAEKSFVDLYGIIVKIYEIEQTLKIENGLLKEINSKISEQEKFQKEIELFITKGSEIINKSQSNVCPLCEQKYDSFNALAQKVSNNSLLSNILSNLLNEKNEKNIFISNLQVELQTEREKLITEITKPLVKDQNKLLIVLSDLKTFNESKVVVISEIESLNKSLNEIISSLNGKTVDEFETEIKNELLKFKLDLDSIVQNNEELKKSILTETESLENHKNKSIILTEYISKLSKEIIYLKMLDYFRINYPEQKISQETFTNEISMLVVLLKTNSDIETKLKEEINDLNTILNQYTKVDIQSHLDLLEKTKDLYIKILNSYEQSVNSKLNIELDSYTNESFTQFINERKKFTQNEILKIESKSKDFNLLSRFKENVTPFLKYEKARIKEKYTRERIEFLKSKISKELETEKNRVSEHLQQQINSFFYEGLINDLYKKIDPHPDYKTVTFKCDFSETKPKLNVCVFQTNQDELIIPNLYFSTAQLNILSLSIFLAKALNAKDDKGKSLDCIFIDDPIQSMDSINILSTIDLIRSIVVNQKKQIILSTHDENFHNLLKKKMPTNLFNSKFMELETFGKVKQNSI